MELADILCPDIDHEHVGHGKRKQGCGALKLLPVGIRTLCGVSALDVENEDVFLFRVRNPNTLGGLRLSSLHSLKSGKICLKQGVQKGTFAT